MRNKRQNKIKRKKLYSKRNLKNLILSFVNQLHFNIINCHFIPESFKIYQSFRYVVPVKGHCCLNRHGIVWLTFISGNDVHIIGVVVS